MRSYLLRGTVDASNADADEMEDALGVPLKSSAVCDGTLYFDAEIDLGGGTTPEQYHKSLEDIVGNLTTYWLCLDDNWETIKSQ